MSEHPTFYYNWQPSILYYSLDEVKKYGVVVNYLGIRLTEFRLQALVADAREKEISPDMKTALQIIKILARAHSVDYLLLQIFAEQFQYGKYETSCSVSPKSDDRWSWRSV